MRLVFFSAALVCVFTTASVFAQRDKADVAGIIIGLTQEFGLKYPAKFLDLSELYDREISTGDVYNNIRLRPLTEIADTIFLGAPVWTKDGKDHLFVRSGSDEEGLYTAELADAVMADPEKKERRLLILVHIPSQTQNDSTGTFEFDIARQPQVRGAVKPAKKLPLYNLDISLRGTINGKGTGFTYRPDVLGAEELGDELCGSYWLSAPWEQLDLPRTDVIGAPMLVFRADNDCLDVTPTDAQQAVPDAGPEPEMRAPTHVAVVDVEGLEEALITEARIGEKPLSDLGDRIGSLRDEPGFWLRPGGKLYLSLVLENLEALEAEIEMDIEGCREPVSLGVQLTRSAAGRTAQDIFDIEPETAASSDCVPFRRFELIVDAVPIDGGIGPVSPAGENCCRSPSDPLFMGNCAGEEVENVLCADERALDTRVGFTRPGYEATVQSLRSLLATPPAASTTISFPPLVLSPRRLTIRLDGLEEDVPTVLLDGKPLRPEQQEGALLHFRLSGLTGSMARDLEVQMPTGWQIPQRFSAEAKEKHSQTILLDNLPLWKDADQTPFLTIAMELSEVKLSGLLLNLQTRLDGELTPTAYGCRPGLAVGDDDPIWLVKSDEGLWAIPKSFPPVDPEEQLRVWADPGTGKRAECPRGDAPVAQLLAGDLEDRDVLEVPVARPLLVYVLRSGAFDQRLGRQPARDYWLKVFDFLQDAARGRVRVVRLQPEGGVFQSLYAPSEFGGLPEIAPDDLLRKSGDGSAPSLEVVMDDAFEQIRAYGRHTSSHAADVLVLTSDDDCSSLRRMATRLRNGASDFEYSLVVLADSHFADVGFDEDDPADVKPVGERCEELPEGTAIVLSDVAGATNEGYPAYPEDAWLDALDVFRGP